MNKTIIRIAVYGFLLAVAVLLVAPDFLEKKKQAQARNVSRSAQAAVAAPVEHVRKFTAEYYKQSDFAMDNAVPFAYPRPASDWLTSEKAFYEKILAAGKFDVMVVPLDWTQRHSPRRSRNARSPLPRFLLRRCN